MSPSTQRYRNSNPEVVIGDFPWYEMVWRGLRGDFRPHQPPKGGYDQFAWQWSVAVNHQRLAKRQQEPVVTWLGHVTILLQVAGLNILLDPTLAPFAGPLGRVGAQRKVPAPLQPDELPPIDLVLISHNHYDHLCDFSISGLLACGQRPQFLVPAGLGSWFTRKGITNVQEMHWWDQVDLGPLRMHFTPAQHWSRRTPFDTNASLWGGYCVEWSDKNSPTWRFLFPGDTGYSADFRDIRRRLGAMDFLALPIGAYLPRDFMKSMHVNPADAVQMMLDLEAKQAMGVHWGTFLLTQESFDQPPKDLAAALKEKQIPSDRVWLLRHGETRTIPRSP
jgi:L-ascorbate metabolism protein UlaG (beta-lactamase superfamily)